MKRPVDLPSKGNDIMAIYSMGKVIKRLRKIKGLTQEELAYGICTPGGLSRIENGTREPSHAKFVALMQRLGQWEDSYDLFVGEEYYEISELQKEISAKVMHHDFINANLILQRYEDKISKLPKESMYTQFLRLQKLIIADNGRIKGEHLAELEDILRMTVPDYGEKRLHELVLGYQELIIVNNIAIGYAENGKRPKAIKLFEELIDFLEDKFMDCRERNYLYAPLVLNLVKYLGLEGRYSEALEWADRAIGKLTEYGKTLYVPELHFDIAWIRIQMDQKKYADIIAEELALSIYGRIGNRQFDSARFLLEYIREHVPEIAARINADHCEELLCRQESGNQKQDCRRTG